jgi:hypothetical protein
MFEPRFGSLAMCDFIVEFPVQDIGYRSGFSRESDGWLSFSEGGKVRGSVDLFIYLTSLTLGKSL